MKILIIEDEILILKSLNKLLAKRGHNVDITSSGQQGISLIQSNEYDRIICDLMLQDISGFDIIESSKVKYSPEEISRLFVIMTAYSSEQVFSQANKYACKILKKPFVDINDALIQMTEE